MERTQVRSRASSATRNDAIASERQWAIFVWRLPMGSSTPRVTVWRLLRRLGAATLTPGAALLPWREDLVERLDWLADEVGEQGGDAWVMRVSELSEAEEQSAIADVNREREQEYAVIRKEAEGFVARSAEHPGDRIGGRRRKNGHGMGDSARGRGDALHQVVTAERTWRSATTRGAGSAAPRVGGGLHERRRPS